ncbi:MAG TPA: S53 family peptidase [Rhizomicrobium sp.]|nr:S53 family peptidase [Rhizomicrobium sp.]
MRRLLCGGLLATGLIVGMTGIAGAAKVERSGNTFYTAVCGFAVGPAARCHANIVTDANGKPLQFAAPPINGKTPADLQSAYKIKTAGSSSTVVAIVDAFGYDNAESDLAVYRAQWGLPACTTDNGCFKKLNEKGKQKKYPAQDIGWAQESALDLDMASAMCPNCQLWLIEGNNNSFKHLAAAVDKAAELGAHVISNSYGAGEFKHAGDWDVHYTHPGVAITVSTGDAGYGVQYPASSPHVTAVGGTHLVADGSKRGWTETVWRGAGSGCSKVFAKPAWQTDKGCRNRMVADVSAVADPATGVAVYGPNNAGVSGWLVFGGTSVSAPLVGGIYGNNAGAVTDGSNPYQHTSDLFDVTSGNNGTCKDGKKAYFCNGEVGYDGPTGLGTPNGTNAFGEH